MFVIIDIHNNFDVLLLFTTSSSSISTVSQLDDALLIMVYTLDCETFYGVYALLLITVKLDYVGVLDRMIFYYTAFAFTDKSR